MQCYMYVTSVRTTIGQQHHLNKHSLEQLSLKANTREKLVENIIHVLTHTARSTTSIVTTT